MDFIDWLQSGVGYPEEFFFATLVRVSQKLYYQRGIVVQSKYSRQFKKFSKNEVDLLECLKSGVGFPEEFFFATLVRVLQNFIINEELLYKVSILDN